MKFMHVDVVNTETDQIIPQALERRGLKEVSEYPGVDFETTTVEGIALLGKFSLHFASGNLHAGYR
jgi:hypothetical protein